MYRRVPWQFPDELVLGRQRWPTNLSVHRKQSAEVRRKYRHWRHWLAHHEHCQHRLAGLWCFLDCPSLPLLPVSPGSAFALPGPPPAFVPSLPSSRGGPSPNGQRKARQPAGRNSRKKLVLRPEHPWQLRISASPGFRPVRLRSVCRWGLASGYVGRSVSSPIVAAPLVREQVLGINPAIGSSTARGGHALGVAGELAVAGIAP
jgi:hypothetical protein